MISIKKAVIESILLNLSSRTPECGGIIGINNNIISDFFFDEIPYDHGISRYAPNITVLNFVINNKWRKSKTDFIGFAHSHYANSKISEEDIKYAQRIIDALNLSVCIMGVVNFQNKDDIVWYEISNDKCREVNINVV